jgi:tetratricopeptide (TPR) repeat protein
VKPFFRVLVVAAVVAAVALYLARRYSRRPRPSPFQGWSEPVVEAPPESGEEHGRAYVPEEEPAAAPAEPWQPEADLELAALEDEPAAAPSFAPLEESPLYPLAAVAAEFEMMAAEDAFLDAIAPPEDEEAASAWQLAEEQAGEVARAAVAEVLGEELLTLDLDISALDEDATLAPAFDELAAEALAEAAEAPAAPAPAEALEPAAEAAPAAAEAITTEDLSLPATVEEALADVPGPPAAGRAAGSYLDEGNVYFRVGQYQLAIDRYDRAIEVDSRLTAAYYNRANAHTRAGNYDLALADYNRALELSPGDTDVLNNRGMLYLYRANYGAALRDFEAALAADPTDTTVMVNRGLAHLHGGDPAAALVDFQEAATLDASDAAAQYGAGQASAVLGNRDQALQWLGRALALDPEYAREAAADAKLASLQGDPDFLKLLRDAGAKRG